MKWSELLSVDPSDPGIGVLNDHSNIRHLQKNETLIHQDERIDHVSLVKTGMLQARFVTFEGTEVWLANLPAGAIVGEISALCDRLSSAHVSAVEPTQVLVAPRSTFLNAMMASSAFGLAIARILAARIADTSNSLSSHVALKIEDRLLNALKTMDTIFVGDAAILVTSVPAISELAVRIHASREATSRTYTRLTRQGVLEKTEEGLLVKVSDRAAQV
jgi:CRP/FNR family cyclic AMP-dependent transcriptional regulator